MIFDPFQINPSSVFVPVDAAPPQGFKLVPQLPATSSTNGVSGSSDDMFNHFLNQGGFNNAPLYEYGFKEERRYSNPYLQFSPNPIGGYDIEDIYGNFQGSGEQLWNSLVKTGATALNSFVSNFTSFGDSIDSLRGGKPFDENSVLGQTNSWLTELEDKYPNYYTQWERENPYLSAITPSGFVNFWGDKVLKNVGFTIGSLASSLLVDAGIELATGGTATPATFILMANQLNKAVSPLKNAFRSLAKTTTLNKVDDLMGVSKVGQGITEGLKGINQAYNLKRGLQFAGVTYFAAQGEAMIEGYQNYYQTRADLYKQELDKGTVTADKIADIEQTAQEVGNTTAALNLPVIMASNLLQFPVIFGGKNILKQFTSPFLDVVNKEGLTVVNNYTRKQAYLKTLKELGKDFLIEGGEEGYQYYIGDSIHDYYLDKFNDTATNSLSNYLIDQLPNTVKDEKFWENVIIGGLAGGLMGGLNAVKTNFANERTNRAVENLNPVFERFNSTVKDFVHFAENVEQANTTDEFQSAHKALFSTVHDSLKYGIYDNFQDNIEDLKNLDVVEYNKLFGTEFNDQQKIRHLNSIQTESLKIKDDLTQVNKFFTDNPFNSPYVSQRLKDIYKVDQTKIENIQRKLFEDYKELMAYNISRLRNTKDQLSNIEQQLKIIGFDDSVIPVLYNLDSEKGKDTYKRFKQIQLDSIKDQVKYYQELDQDEPELKLKEKSLEKLIKELDKPFNSERFRELIFEEELGNKQLAKEEDIKNKLDELKKSQQLNVNVAEDLEKQTNNPFKKVKEQIETIATIVPPPVKKAPVPKIEGVNLFNKQFGNLKAGDQFEVSLTTEPKGVYTVVTVSPLIAVKDGISYQFLPDRIIKYDNGEQVLRYELSNIGVQKIEKEIEEKQPVQPVQPTLKETKKIVSRQRELVTLIDQNKDKPVKPVKGGIYIIEGDYTNAWRYVDENTAVPIKLKIKKGELDYDINADNAIEKTIESGYLLDDTFVQPSEPLGVDIRQVLEIYSQEQLEQEPSPSKGKMVDLTSLIKGVKDTDTNQKSNLTQFIGNSYIDDNLKTILEWRLGKGIKIDC